MLGYLYSSRRTLSSSPSCNSLKKRHQSTNPFQDCFQNCTTIWFGDIQCQRNSFPPPIASLYSTDIDLGAEEDQQTESFDHTMYHFDIAYMCFFCDRCRSDRYVSKAEGRVAPVLRRRERPPFWKHWWQLNGDHSPLPLISFLHRSLQCSLFSLPMNFVPYRHPFWSSNFYLSVNSTLSGFISGSDFIFLFISEFFGFILPPCRRVRVYRLISPSVFISIFSIGVTFHLRIYFTFLEIAIGTSTTIGHQIYNNLLLFWWVYLCFFSWLVLISLCLNSF